MENYYLPGKYFHYSAETAPQPRDIRRGLALIGTSIVFIAAMTIPGIQQWFSGEEAPTIQENCSKAAQFLDKEKAFSNQIGYLSDRGFAGDTLGIKQQCSQMEADVVATLTAPR